VVTSLNDNPPTEADLEAAWVLADEDQSGGIDFDEFVLLYAKVKRGDVVGLTSDPEALAKRVAEFFERNGIKADPEATLKKWEGKEAQLLKSMVVHDNRGDDEEEQLMHDVLTTGDVLWLEAAFQNYISKVPYTSIRARTHSE